MTSRAKLNKFLNRQLTVMLIPHHTIRPVRLEFSIAFLVFSLVAWTGLTVWSGLIAGRHIDYWRIKTDEQVLRAKVWYLAQEMKRSREYLDRVREAEVALQHLLNMKSRSAILESEGAIGGPSPMDQKQLAHLLTGTLDTVEDVGGQLNSMNQARSVVMTDFQEITHFIKAQRDLFRATPQSWPANGRLTSSFGIRKSPLENWTESEFHRGIDIANEAGTPVHATADGIVQLASWQGGYGRLIVLDHGHGFRTCYAHNSRLLVKPGDRVRRGQVISYMGTSGRSTGYHLHYEVWENGEAVNPMQFVKARIR